MEVTAARQAQAAEIGPGRDHTGCLMGPDDLQGRGKQLGFRGRRHEGDRTEGAGGGRRAGAHASVILAIGCKLVKPRKGRGTHGRPSAPVWTGLRSSYRGSHAGLQMSASVRQHRGRDDGVLSPREAGCPVSQPSSDPPPHPENQVAFTSVSAGSTALTSRVRGPGSAPA